MKKFLSLITLFFLILSLPVLAKTNVENTPTIQKQDLLKEKSQSWDGIPYKSYPFGTPEITVLKMIIPAHSKLPWHYHNVPNVGYVISGELKVESCGTNETKTLKAGDVIAEMVNTVHRGMTGDKPVELILFYAGAKEVPITVEKSCGKN